MTWPLWSAFTAATIVLLVIPGPTILTVIGYSLSHGRRAQWPLVTAVALGDSTALGLSLLGLGTLLATSAFWFTVVKWAGGLYLIWLGGRMLRLAIRPDEASAASDGADRPGEPAASALSAVSAVSAVGATGRVAMPLPVSRGRLFANTYFVTALNPKGMIFFVAFLPQFLSPAAPVGPQLWLLSLTFVVLATVNAALYAVFAAHARRLLDTPAARRRFNLAGGALLGGAGIWALLARRPS